MDTPKYEVGQEIEAQYNDIFISAVVESIEAKYTYAVRFSSWQQSVYTRSEDQIRLPRPTEEEAWEKATILIGVRSQYAHANLESWNRETRHQVYQILGSAGIRITDELKRDVRRLISVADSL